MLPDDPDDWNGCDHRPEEPVPYYVDVTHEINPVTGRRNARITMRRNDGTAVHVALLDLITGRDAEW